MGREVTLPSYPQRIISLVPSQTELLYDLGLGDKVVGITKFCIYPDEWFKSKPRVGGTKELKHDIIKNLKPDLIIGNKEENRQEDIEALMQHYPVWMSDITTLEDAAEMVLGIGEITNTKPAAKDIVSQLKTGFSTIAPMDEKPTVLYLIWKPYMAAGTDTFINTMLGLLGFKNIIDKPRYPKITPEQLFQLKPNYIFLSSEPYPFKEKHIADLQALSPQSKILLVDGEMFSWYGSRLIKAIEYFKVMRDEWRVANK